MPVMRISTLKYIQKEFRLNIGEGTMVKLTEEMKEAFAKMKVFPVATASKEGTPNVIPLGIAWLMSDDTVWLIVGFLGQALFSGRFLVQWIVSERKKQSVIPAPRESLRDMF